MTISVNKAGINHQLGLVRPKSASSFDAADIAHVRVLMPHLQRAVALRRQLAGPRRYARRRRAQGARHRASCRSAARTSRNRRLMHANAAGDALLGKADGLGTSGLGASQLGAGRGGLLTAATPAWSNRLHDALGRAAGTHGTPARASALRLPRPRRGHARRARHAVPSRSALVAVPPAGGAGVRDRPQRDLRVAGTADRDLFGLTGAEAALAADLLSRQLGAGDRRAARPQRQHGSHTAPLLMAKTEVSRQSALLRLLASLPRLPATRSEPSRRRSSRCGIDAHLVPATQARWRFFMHLHEDASARLGRMSERRQLSDGRAGLTSRAAFSCIRQAPETRGVRFPPGTKRNSRLGKGDEPDHWAAAEPPAQGKPSRAPSRTCHPFMPDSTAMSYSYVYSGPAVTSVTLNDGDLEFVFNGGKTVDTTVNSGGDKDVAGGAVTSTTVSGGGYEVISSGGVASDTEITSGGTADHPVGRLGGRSRSASRQHRHQRRRRSCSRKASSCRRPRPRRRGARRRAYRWHRRFGWSTPAASNSG